MFLFSSTLTEALILHIADRSDVEMAKCDDSRVRWKSILQRKSICICAKKKGKKKKTAGACLLLASHTGAAL